MRYFVDKSFLFYDETSEIEIRKRLKDYLLDENESISVDSIFNDIKISDMKCDIKIIVNLISITEISRSQTDLSFFIIGICDFIIFKNK